MESFPIFYLTNDPWRGGGVEGVLDDYHVISVDDSSYVDVLVDNGIKVLSLARELNNPNPIVRNTRKLLLHPMVTEYMLKNSDEKLGIVFFKPQFDLLRALEGTELLAKRRVISLNPKTTVAKRLENKLNFFNLCKANEIPVAKGKLIDLFDINYEKMSEEFGRKLVLQFAVGWFGNKTFFINSEQDLKRLQETYSNAQVKISEYIEGYVLTNNVVIGRDETFQSFPFLQVTDDSGELARKATSTVGNAWLDADELTERSPEVIDKIRDMTDKLSQVARLQGFVGYAGFDFLVSNNGRVYAQEINARFTASAPMLAELERKGFGSSILDKHYEAFGVPVRTRTLVLDDYFSPLRGSRIVARNTYSEPLVLGDVPENGEYLFSSSAPTESEGANFVLLTPIAGRRVNPDQEMVHLMSESENYDWLKKEARKIKEEILEKAHVAQGGLSD